MRSDNAKVLLQMHEAGYLKRFMRRFDENREDNKKRPPGGGLSMTYWAVFTQARR